MKITLYGATPPKKNSKRVFCNGRRPIVLPSQKHEDWHKETMIQLRVAKVPKDKWERFDVDITFFVPDKRRRDNSNMFESVMDALTDYGLIEDDSCWNTNDIHIRPAVLDRENPRTEILLKKIETK